MQYIVLDLGWRGGGLLISPSLPFLSGQWVGGGSEVQKGGGKEGVGCFAVCASRRIEGKRGVRRDLGTVSSACIFRDSTIYKI